MIQGEMHEHSGYLADDRRNAAYRTALAEVVRPGDVVLDLGAGTGVLGCLACDAGAGSVIAVDRGSIIDMARRIAEANGYADRITHVQAMSTELELDAPVDVVVCDQVGGTVHDAGILVFFADARRRLLAPGGRLVPAAFRILVAPVTFDLGREGVEFWSSRPGSLDVGAARPTAANTEWKYVLTADDLVRLAPGAEMAAFASDHDDPISGTATFTVDRSGRFDGFIGWFEAQMSPSVTMTNDPWSPDRFDRWCNFYPVDEAVEVDAGDEITMRLDIRPIGNLASWTVDVAHADGRRRQARQSTFLTLSTDDLLAPNRIVPRTPAIDLARTVLDLIDGQRTAAQIVDALGDPVASGFASRIHAENFVRKVASLAG